MTIFPRFLAITILVILAFATAGSADTVYVAGADNDFGTLDLSTGTFTSIGVTSQTFYGMGFSGGTLYGLDSEDRAKLYKINPATGATTEISVPNTHDADGATAGPGGLLYAISYYSGDLYTVNPVSGVIHVIGNTGLGVSDSFTVDGLLAFVNGVLYTDASNSSLSDEGLYSVNLTTGLATRIGATGAVQPMDSGVFADGTLYGFSLDDQIYTIDTATGAATRTGSYDLDHGGGEAIYAAAALPSASPVPEPSTFMPLMALMLCLTVLRWKCCRT
ncbi:MAG TPA: hypothetical protein VKV17_00845 [Bryobacteraceae bacterium]|nr:hypothetical protein [Bryobacteraceae bacterium]